MADSFEPLLQHFSSAPGSPSFAQNYKGSASLPNLDALVNLTNTWNAAQTKTAATPAIPARNPIVQRVLDAAGREAAAMVQNPLGRTVIGTPKSPQLASRVNAAYGEYDSFKPVKQQSIKEYVDELIANKPKNKAARDQEAESVDRVFREGPGSLSDDLAQNQRAQRLAVRAAAQQALGRASRDRNISQMFNGNSSYLARAYGDTLSRIMADEALKNSALGRENILATQSARNGLLGTRQRLADDYANSLRLPGQALDQYQHDDLGLLSSLGNVEDANTIYDSYTPEQAFARRMGLIDQLNQLQEMGVDPSVLTGQPYGASAGVTFGAPQRRINLLS